MISTGREDFVRPLADIVEDALADAARLLEHKCKEITPYFIVVVFSISCCDF
jgi:hypothetical protein